jgi:hypothetical protein
MGLFKKLTVRNKPKSTWDLTEDAPKPLPAHESDIPKQTAGLSSFTEAQPPPPYKLEADLGDEEIDTGSILIGIDFGTT